MKETFRIDAHPRYLVATDAAGFLVGAVLLFAASRIPSILSPLALALLVAALALGFGIDVAVWLRRGVRSIELREDRLTLFRGRAIRAEVYARETVSGIRAVRRLGRHSAVLSVPRGSRRRRLRIREDAFPREAFDHFLAALGKW